MYELSWYTALYTLFVAVPLLFLFAWYAFARSEQSGGMAVIVAVISFALMVITPHAAFLTMDGSQSAILFAILAAVGIAVSAGLTYMFSQADERPDDRARPGASHIQHR